MKKIIKLGNIGFLLLVLLLCSACAPRVDLNRQEKRKNITLVVKMKGGDYWNTVKMGADAAAREFGVDVEFSAPEEETDVEEQIELVNRAIEKKTDALVLAASDFKALVEVTEKAYDQRIPVIIIDSEVDTEKINGYVAMNNYEAGIKAGERLIEAAGSDCRVGIMNFVEGSRNAEQREAGLLEALSRYPNVRVEAKEYCLSNVRLAQSLTRKMLEEHPQLNVIVGLNANASAGVAQTIYNRELAGKVKVIAFDSTYEEIDFLDKGVIQATIVQNPFTMGYLGIKHAVEVMAGRKIPKFADTGLKVIDRENMYLPENQKLLFPFIK